MLSRIALAIVTIVATISCSWFLVSSPSQPFLNVTNVDDEDDDDHDHQHELKIKFSEAPADAQKAIQKHVGDRQIESVDVERVSGTTVYEAEWSVDGKDKEVAVMADGSLIGMEEDIALSDAPHSVQAEIMRHLPKEAKVSISRKMIVAYEIDVQIEGEEHSVLVTPAGHELHIEAELHGEEDEEEDEEWNEEGHDHEHGDHEHGHGDHDEDEHHHEDGDGHHNDHDDHDDHDGHGEEDHDED